MPSQVRRSMLAPSLSAVIAAASNLLMAACGESSFARVSCAEVDGTCREFQASEGGALLEYANSLSAGATIVLAKGIFEIENQVTIRQSGVRLVGQGMDETVLSFAAQASQSNGLDIVGDDIRVGHLAVADAKKDAVRIEASDGVHLDHVRATWSGGPSSTNGAYGLYPVKSSRVLIEGCEAFNAADAGIYVGQSQHAVVRDSVARGNVAGLEIENTQFVAVYDNLVEDNTAGLLVFDLPGNPIPGRDVLIHRNVVRDNNRDNFAPGGTVRAIPAGTGTFVMASRRVEVSNNSYENNNTADVTVLSGLIIQDGPAWKIPADQALGKTDGLDLPKNEAGDLFNYRTNNVLITGNTFIGGGNDPDGGDMDGRPLGFLLELMYGIAGEPVDAILYDTIDESSFDPQQPQMNSNDNTLCIGDNEGASFASLNLPVLSDMLPPVLEAVYRPEAPFAPFNCDAIAGSEVQKPAMGSLQ